MINKGKHPDKTRLAAWIFALLAAAAAVYIFANSAKTASESDAQSDKVVDKVEDACTSVGITTERSLLERFVRKSAHFIEYFIFGGLVTLSALLFARGKKIIFSLLVSPVTAAAVALIDEFAIQTRSSGRSAELGDALIDLSGAVAATVITALLKFGICALIRRRRAKKDIISDTSR